MRPRLLHPLRERDARRPGRRPHDRRADPAQPGPPPARRGAARLRRARPGGDRAPPAGCDPLAERVREAGGPIDTALYTCCCGYLFSAAVSTTVACRTAGQIRPGSRAPVVRSPDAAAVGDPDRDVARRDRGRPADLLGRPERLLGERRRADRGHAAVLGGPHRRVVHRAACADTPAVGRDGRAARPPLDDRRARDRRPDRAGAQRAGAGTFVVATIIIWVATAAADVVARSLIRERREARRDARRDG